MSKSVIVVGVQWGDEGKGKVVDILSKKSDYVVRSQGGNNAGHTIVVDNEEYKFHLIPSGALYPNNVCLITGGTVIDLAVLAQEIKLFTEKGVKLDARLKLSTFAHVIMPYHKLLDRLYEKSKGDLAIGTTGKGIGPCYSDKALRVGFQVGDLLNKQQFEKKLNIVLQIKNSEIQNVYGSQPLEYQQIVDELYDSFDYIKSYVSSDVEQELASALDANKKVLFEGAHGTFLDTTYGTYPYVTSSSTTSAGVCSGAGIGPTKIGHVLGVVKAYTTRVGSGPLPSALSEEELKHFMDNVSAREVGTTTGRNRRIAWFDVPMIKKSIQLNGVNSLALMKLDVLDMVPVIKICIGYKYQGQTISAIPSQTSEWDMLEPIYELFPGWQETTSHVKSFDDLPVHAKIYLRRLEDLCNCPISLLSLGPERNKTIIIHPFMD